MKQRNNKEGTPCPILFGYELCMGHCSPLLHEFNEIVMSQVLPGIMYPSKATRHAMQGEPRQPISSLD